MISVLDFRNNITARSAKFTHCTIEITMWMTRTPGDKKSSIQTICYWVQFKSTSLILLFQMFYSQNTDFVVIVRHFLWVDFWKQITLLESQKCNSANLQWWHAKRHTTLICHLYWTTYYNYRLELVINSFQIRANLHALYFPRIRAVGEYKILQDVSSSNKFVVC